MLLPIYTFDFGGYDYWRLWISAGTALAVLKFGVCGCRPYSCGQCGVAFISAKNNNRQRRKRQSVTANQEKSQTPNFVTAILTYPI